MGWIEWAIVAIGVASWTVLFIRGAARFHREIADLDVRISRLEEIARAREAEDGPRYDIPELDGWR